MTRRLLAEGLGTAILVATVVGSGIMAERLAGGNQAIALLGNTIPTGAILVVLISILAPVSGAHFNPAVTLAFAVQGTTPWRDVVPWLLKPNGFTKWHFAEITKKFGCFQIQCFLRWIASEEAFGRNINDLADEGTGKLIEMTIRYKDFEWSISCGETDYLGHQTTSLDSQKPHYHFQMRYKKGAFIRFNDFHNLFTVQDIHTIEAMKAEPGFITQHFAGAPGMNDILNHDTVEELIKHGTSSGKEDEAQLKLDTIIMADEGTTIAGEDLYNIFQEAKEKGVTIASLIPKLKNATAKTIVTPGPGVVEQTPRSGRGSRGKKD